MAFTTVYVPYFSVNSCGLLILPLVNDFHDGVYAVLLIRMAQQITADCSYLRSSMAFMTVCAPYCPMDISRFLLLPVVNSFHYDLRAGLLSG